MSELTSCKKRRRTGFIAFSPAFKERIKQIRSELGIPSDGFPTAKLLNSEEPGGFYPKQAIKWYENQVEKATGKRSKDLPHYYRYFPEELAKLVEDLAYSSRPCRTGFHPDVTLDRLAMDLVREFGLPEDSVNEVKRRILVEENAGFTVSSPLQLIFIPVNEQEEGTKFVALIAGIDSDTTRKDWLDMWEQVRRLMSMNDVEMSTTKREEEKILLRDLTWWEWSKHLTPKQIADKWEAKEGKAYGEDTIRAPIHRIDETMRPISPQIKSKVTETKEL